MVWLKGSFSAIISTYIIHFTEETPAQDLLQNRYTLVIHNTQNHTQWTYRVHTTSLKENLLHTMLVSFTYICFFTKIFLKHPIIPETAVLNSANIVMYSTITLNFFYKQLVYKQLVYKQLYLIL